MATLQIGFVQFSPRYLAVEENLHRTGHLLDRAEAELLVLPELFQSGYFFQSIADLEQVAEPVPEGPTTQWLVDKARQQEMTLVAGLAERDGDRFYNSAVVAGPEGFVGTYRKTHLFYEEKTHFTPGDSGLEVFELTSRAGVSYRLGVMICFDWYFPESARTLALKGADIIAHPSNLVLPHCPRAMPVRAIENHVFTVTANRCGTEQRGEETLNFIGQSLVCSPDGAVLAKAGSEEDSVQSVAVDPEEARRRQINAYNDVLGDRRPGLYA